MTELHLRREHLGASTDGPGNNRLGDLALLDGLDDSVLLGTTDLTKKQEQLALWVGLVTEQVIDERGTGVSVSTNGDTFVNTVGGVRQDVVELVRHTTRLGDIADGSRSVQLAGDEVVHHTTGVSNPEASRFDSSDSRGADDDDTLADRQVQEFSSVTLGHTLSDDTDRLDLRVTEDVERGGVHGSRRTEVDNDIDVWVFLNSLADGGVDWEKSLLGAPVELLDVVSTEGVNHGSDGRSLSSAGEVEIKHSLDRSGLKTKDERTGVGIERSEPRTRTVSLGLEVHDVVAGLLSLAVGFDCANSILLRSRA